MPGALDRVLRSASLLSLIFSHADGKSQARGAQVCKLWFEPAVKCLWHSLKTVDDLFRLLPAVKRCEYPVLCYDVMLDDGWHRFDAYAKHVRYLIFDCKGASAVHDTLLRMAYTSGVTSLLPNLDVLEISCGAHIINTMYFLPSGPHHLSVLCIYGINNTTNTYTILRHVLPLLTKLKSLRLQWNCYIYPIDFEDDFTLAFSAMRQLEVLTIQEFQLTTKCLDVLATLPKLKRLLYAFTLDKETIEMPEQQNCIQAGTTKDPTFPSLEYLFLGTTSSIITLFFSYDFKSSNFKTSVIDITNKAGEKALRHCFAMLTLKCNALEYLTIRVMNPVMTLSNSGCGFETLKYNTFCTFGGLRLLKNFSFQYYGDRLLISDTELKELVQNWTQLENLHFTSRPYLTVNPSLTLLSLLTLSKYCRNLKTLSLDIDATSVPELPCDLEPLDNLQTIAFGFSPVSDTDAVALTLSQLCTPNCRIVIENTDLSRNDAGQSGLRLLWGARQEGWNNVAKSYNLIMKALTRERRSRRVRSL